MIQTLVEPLDRRTFEAGRLVREYPPRWDHRNKRLVWARTASAAPFEGSLEYARWPGRPLPELLAGRQSFTAQAGVFGYPPEPDGTTVSWHLNFADPLLFGFYSGPLLAQDELQVLEHPALGSLRDCLDALGSRGMTEDLQGRPTPVTVAGVQRRCVLHTAPDPAAGRPGGLYGNAFGRADAEQVARATEVLLPPTCSNILAIAAPSGGSGPYTSGDIEGVLGTAYSGFAAAALESERILGPGARTLVHTGFWGCGAFGGNRMLMTILQALAADLAGVDLVFHGVDHAGASLASEAHARYLSLRSAAEPVPGLRQAIAGMGFSWGEPDGN